MNKFKKILMEQGFRPTSPVMQTKDVRKANYHAVYKDDEAGSNARLQSIYNQHMPMFLKIKSQYERIVKKSIPSKLASNKKEVKFVSQIKPLTSFIDKVKDRGNKIPSVGDIVRGAVVFKDVNDVHEFVEAFKRRNSSIIFRYDFKEQGSDQQFGYYGSHHFGIMIDGLITELQVMTRKLWSYKKIAHNIYTKLRTNLSQGKPVSPKDQELSKQIFRLGNRPTRREDIEDLEDYEFDLDLIFEFRDEFEDVDLMMEDDEENDKDIIS